jgi:hypothetical protein
LAILIQRILLHLDLEFQLGIAILFEFVIAGDRVSWLLLDSTVRALRILFTCLRLFKVELISGFAAGEVTDAARHLNLTCLRLIDLFSNLELFKLLLLELRWILTELGPWRLHLIIYLEVILEVHFEALLDGLAEDVFFGELLHVHLHLLDGSVDDDHRVVDNQQKYREYHRISHQIPGMDILSEPEAIAEDKHKVEANLIDNVLSVDEHIFPWLVLDHKGQVEYGGQHHQGQTHDGRVEGEYDDGGVEDATEHIHQRNVDG